MDSAIIDTYMDPPAIGFHILTDSFTNDSR